MRWLPVCQGYEWVGYTNIGAALGTYNTIVLILLAIYGAAGSIIPFALSPLCVEEEKIEFERKDCGE